MEETTEKTKTVSMSDLRWRRFELVLGIVSIAGFVWLTILLIDVLTNPAVIIEYAPADPRSGVWIQGVQFSQLVVAFTLSGAFGVFRTARWVIQELRKVAGWPDLAQNQPQFKIQADDFRPHYRPVRSTTKFIQEPNFAQLLLTPNLRPERRDSPITQPR